MKEISVEGHGLNAMCRLCLSKGVTLLDMFHFSVEMKTRLSNIIMQCAPVQIRRYDEMPNFICRLCYTQLKNIHQFQTQIVQSDKTLRRYLQQLLASDKQIKPECSIQKCSEEHLINKTNPCDIIVKCESIVIHDIFDGDLNTKKIAPINCKSTNKMNEEIPLKYDIKDEPTDVNSLTDLIDNTVETSSKADGSEFVCEDSKVDSGHISENNLAECLNKTEDRDTDVSVKYEKHNKASTKKYHCDICNKTFTQTCNLKSHIRIHTGEKPYECDVCSKCFRQLGNLKNHKRTHTGEKPYKCDVCNKCFSQSSVLNIHKRTHTGEKPYQCDVCNKCFIKSSYLNGHKRTHTGEKPYQCDVCNKCFCELSNLKDHKRIHTGEKPYQCDVCNTGFSTSTTLNIHKRTHTGEEPYKCDVCNRCFRQSSDLNIHKRTHTGEKPYRCDVCNRCFSLLKNLIRHKRIHTGNKLT